MEFKESLKLLENVEIRVIKEGKVVEVTKLKNLIVDTGLNMLRDAKDGAISDCEIKYVAFGGTATAVDHAQIKLTSEFFRKVMTSKTPGAVGILVSTVYIAPYEANVPKIEEIGWFAGVGATIAADSGIMVARVLYSHAKTALESLQVVRTDTIS